MFIYEKDGKLNIAFQTTQIPPEKPNIVIDVNSIKNTTNISVDGEEINTEVNFDVSEISSEDEFLVS